MRTIAAQILWLSSCGSSSCPLRSTFAAPYTKPAHVLNALAVHMARSEETNQKESMDVRELMHLLEQTYPPSSTDAYGNQKQTWARTRKYLYQYRANLSRNTSTNSNTESITKKRKRTSRNRGPLTLTHVQQIISFLRTTFPNHPKLQALILQNTPRILSQHHSIESRLLPTVEFLKELYGDMAGSDGKMGSMFFDAIERKTDLLLVRGVGYVIGGNARSGSNESCSDNCSQGVEYYLQNVLGISSHVIIKLKKNQPTLFQLSLKDKVQPAVEYLFSLLMQDASIKTIQSKEKKQLVKIVMNHSNLFQLDVDTNLRPTTKFLRDYCELAENELATIVGSIPAVLGLAVDGNLRPKLQLLLDILTKGAKQEVDGSKKALKASILKHPQILALSSTNIRTKVEYFDEIDIKSNVEHDNTLAARLLTTAPSVYSLSLVENIMPKVNYLASLWGWSSLSDKLCECPLLTLSMDNIQQTLSFYNVTGYIDLPNEEGGALSRQSHCIVRSRYIATSLYNRLLPRWNFLLEERERNKQFGTPVVNDDVNKISKTTSSQITRDKVQLPPLHLLAGATDEVFCRQLNLSLGEYTKFKEEAIPRLKFNSQFDRWLKTGRPIDLISATDDNR